ncbi:hypothetical protein LZG04_25395 [Saccharothrix sp. S26]|uniref:hypothetical protein n=1 Tax=Saccharothrix sp. S26 TaxID=2907215 RepID=UPI001F1F773E|nr:hypothetical protein [Saccharothrix sp. S26]MCE6998106.1 hypothetical protein [Saccharothrix sp. S26]
MNRRTALRIPAVAALAMAALTAPAHAEPATMHAPGEVHLVRTLSGGEIAHTIRRADGSWYPFNTIPNAPRAHYTNNLTSAIVGNEEHVMHNWYYGVGPYYQAYRYVIRHADGSWTEENPVADGPTSDVDLTAVAGELHRVQRGGDNGAALTHRIRHADGTWTPWTAIPAQVDFDSDFAIAGAGSDLRLLTLNPPADTVLSSFVRHADGTWEQRADVPFTPRSGTTAVAVDIAQVGTELHAVVVGNDGALYHAALRSTGWTSFHEVASQTGAPGGTVTQFSITASLGTLHVALTTSENRLLHTIRTSDGRWLPFGDVNQATTLAAPWNGLSIAGS